MSFFQSKQKDGTVSILAYGYVTKDPFIPESGKLVLFSVCYGKDKYIDCKVWSSSKAGQLAACLEKHDEVGVAGVWEQYTDKDGNKRDQIRVDHIAVQIEAPQADAADDDGAGGRQNTFTELADDDEGEVPF